MSQESKKSKKSKKNRDSEDRVASRRSRRSRAKKSKWTKAQKRNIAIVCIIVFVVSFAYIKNVISLKIENAKLQKENEALVEERREIKEKLKNVDNVEYIEEQARKQLQLMYPDELLFKYSEEDKSKSDE